MVGEVFTPSFGASNKVNWLRYLVLALVVNGAILSLVTITKTLPTELPVLRINLMALAPQKHNPTPSPAAPIAPPIAPEVVTTHEALSPVAPKVNEVKEIHEVKEISKPVAKPTFQPVAEPVIKPVEAPKMPPTPQPMPQPAPMEVSPKQPPAEVAQTVIHEAKYRNRKPPIYPRRALELGQQGMVTLHVEVMPSGHPSRLRVADSSGYGLLDSAALRAVKKWEFFPTLVNDSATTSWVRVPVNFVIKK